jgi:hypothetical protein
MSAKVCGPFDMHRYLTDEAYNQELYERGMAAMREAGAKLRQRQEAALMEILEPHSPCVVIMPPGFDPGPPWERPYLPEYVI